MTSETWSIVSSVGAAVAAVIALAAWASSELRATAERRRGDRLAKAAAEQRALEDLLRALVAFAGADLVHDNLPWTRWRLAAQLALLAPGAVPALESMRLDRDPPVGRPRDVFGPTADETPFPLEEAILQASARLQASREEHGVLTAP